MKKLLLPLLVTTLVACGGDEDEGPNIEASGGVEFPEDWRDLTVIGATDRTEQPETGSDIVLVLGNDIAANSAKQIAANQTSDWDEGSRIVRVVWKDEINQFSADTTAPGTFASVTVMEKDLGEFSETGGWGYGLWRGDALEPADTSQPLVNNESCFACHDRQVAPTDDFVFTKPLALPADATFQNAGPSTGIALPADIPNWKFISVHYRQNANQVRVVVGNDIAVDAARSGETNPWPEGAQFADLVFAAQRGDAWVNMQGTGSFTALAFMEKDSSAYPAENGGWGYGIWRTSNLEPAADVNAPPANGSETCAQCHNRVVSGNDYVFTKPGPLPSGDQ